MSDEEVRTHWQSFGLAAISVPGSAGRAGWVRLPAYPWFVACQAAAVGDPRRAAAQLHELLDFLHRHLTAATENIRTNEDGTQVTLSYADWQRVLAVQMLLARYVRAVAEPDALDE